MIGNWETKVNGTTVYVGECVAMNEQLIRIADALERIANIMEAQQRDAGRNCTLDCFGGDGE